MAQHFKSGFLVILLFLTALLPGASAAQGQPKSVRIPDGTALRLALTAALSSATNKNDDQVNFELTEDVKVGDVVMIPKGATAVGHVTEAEPRRRMGRAGKLNFSVDYVKGPDGSNIRVRTTAARKGEDKTGTVIVGTVLLSPLFLIMRGKDVVIPMGTAFTAYVDGDRDIALGGPTVAIPAGQQTVAVEIKSTPDGADIAIDGKYMGSTPSSVPLVPGDHTIQVEKPGFKVWKRVMTVAPGGAVSVNATLEQNQ
jgi:hypothetical protein